MKKIVALVLCLALALALCTVAFATQGDTYYYAKRTSEPNATLTDITLTYVKAAEPTTNKDGVQTARGKIAHYVVRCGDLELGAYTVVDSLAKADLVIYSDVDTKHTVLFLEKIAHPEFYDAKVFTNFGTKCGQFNYAGYDKSVTYYDVDGKLYAGDEDGTEALRVGGKFVAATFKTEITAVPHAEVPVLKDGKIVGYECDNCKLAAVKAPNAMSLPKGVEGFGEEGLWYFPAAAAGTTPTTGVTSAKTFDAGVAMYAGLALMSVAGSAVVIGKKKEF